MAGVDISKAEKGDLWRFITDLLVTQRQLYDQLGHVQDRCTEKEEEIRDLKRQLGKKEDDDGKGDS